MSRILPILFNTEMVLAILDGRKTVTRRLIKAPVLSKVEPPKKVTLKNGVANFEWNTPKTAGGFEIKMPYQPGDILYIRETWQYIGFAGENNGYVYKASENGKLWEAETENWTWHPSIHMPKEAARIWLKVKDVRVERLQDMSDDDCEKEGLENFCNKCSALFSNCDTCLNDGGIKEDFKELWNSTIKKSDIDRYGWDANPWVWVIEFERCEKPENF